MIKLFNQIAVLCCISVNIYSQTSTKKYYSYPDRILEFQILEGILLWRNTQMVNNKYEKPDTLNFVKRNDTLFIEQRTNYGNENQIIIFNGNFADYIRFGDLDTLDNQTCGILFQQNSRGFRRQTKKIQNSVSRESYNRIMELHNRLMRIEIFGRICDDPLPPLYYEHL